MKPPHELAQDFADFCKANPELRFWQALAAFSDIEFIYAAKDMLLVANKETTQDTFYWNNLNEL